MTVRPIIFLAILFSMPGCSTAPADRLGCDTLREQQATRQACLDAAPGCSLSVSDMRKFRNTAATLDRYCK